MRRVTFGSKLSIADVLSQLELQDLESESSVELDLSDVEFIDITGIAPLICLGAALADRGISTEWVLPDPSSPAGHELEVAGWRSAITTGSSGHSSDANFTDLFVFSNDQNLNPALAKVMDQLSLIGSFAPGTLTAIQFVISELSDNVLTHSGSLGWMQLGYRPNRGEAHICIADIGRGVRGSLSKRYILETDQEAVDLAVQEGVTSGDGQGNGLYMSLRLAAALGGYMNIVSGSGLFRQFPHGAVYRGLVPGRGFRGRFPGTVLTLTVKTDVSVDVAEALGYQPLRAFEATHFTYDGVTFSLAKESHALSNRATGRSLAVRLQNIAAEAAGLPVVIDFEGVSLASASFLDEFLAKLIADEGVSTFFSRFQLRGMDRLTQQTLDHVIRQRQSQGPA